MEHQIFDLTFAGSRASVLCGFPDEEAVLDLVELLANGLKDMDGSGNGLQVL